MTEVERLILENQKTILHGLRILLSRANAPHHQFAMQDQMERTGIYLEEHK